MKSSPADVSVAEEGRVPEIPQSGFSLRAGRRIVARRPSDVRVAVTGAGGDGVFRATEFEEALKKRFSAKSLDGLTVSADGLNSDIHGSAEYRASDRRAHPPGRGSRHRKVSVTGVVSHEQDSGVRRCNARSAHQSRLSRRAFTCDGGLPSPRMGRPLFLEGEAGVGKTEIAKVLSAALGRKLIRLQCYEGLDVASAVYEWNSAAQMIAIRLAEASGETDREQLSADVFAEKVPDQTSAVAGAGAGCGRSAGAADRRTRSCRRSVRGLSARNPQRLSGHDPEFGTVKAPQPPS
jgi:hypothetical protein